MFSNNFRLIHDLKNSTCGYRSIDQQNTSMAELNNILLVDDDEISNFVSLILLKKYSKNLKVSIVLNGQEAVHFLESCEDNYPSVVLLDINMPFMNGFEFLEWYHTSPYQGKSKIVMLTTSSRAKDKERSFLFQDVIHYLEKPLTTGKVEALVREFH